MPSTLHECCDMPPTRVASVWDATVSLLRTPAAFGHNFSTITHDGVHHWMAVNVMKANALLRTIAAAERERLREAGTAIGRDVA